MYRQQTGFPQTLLADRMGVSLPTYKRTETGGRMATPSEIASFAAFTGIPLSCLTDDMQDLPSPLPPTPRVSLTLPGRPTKSVTPDTAFRGQQVAGRIKQVIQSRFSGNAREFAQAVMLDETMLSGYLSGKREITERLILKVVRNLPTLSADWLRVGVGAMEAQLAPVLVVDCHDGTKLVNYLNKHGLTGADLQRAMGLSSLSSVTDYKASVSIRHPTRVKIAQALHVSVQDIFGC